MKSIYLFLICFVLAGCEIDNYCWTCEDVYTTTSSDGRTINKTTFTSERCDLTSAEIEDYEEAGSYSVTTTSNGVTTVSTITVNCRR